MEINNTLIIKRHCVRLHIITKITVMENVVEWQRKHQVVLARMVVEVQMDFHHWENSFFGYYPFLVRDEDLNMLFDLGFDSRCTMHCFSCLNICVFFVLFFHSNLLPFGITCSTKENVKNRCSLGRSCHQICWSG